MHERLAGKEVPTEVWRAFSRKVYAERLSLLAHNNEHEAHKLFRAVCAETGVDPRWFLDVVGYHEDDFDAEWWHFKKEGD